MDRENNKINTEDIPSVKSNYKDELMVIMAVFSVFVILILLDAFHAVYAYAKDNPEYQIDKIVLLYIPLSLMSIWGASLQFRQKRELIKSYYIDKLTGVPNRVAFRSDFEKRSSSNLVVVNIVNFKTVNKTLGLEEGDELLKKAIVLLQEIVGEFASEKIYRLYGDELGFFYDGDEKKTKSVCRQIQDKFQKTLITTDDIEIRLDINMSFSGIEPKFQTAMMAMERARVEPDNAVVSYDDAMNDVSASKHNILMLKIIKAAIEQNKVFPFFQAMVDNQSGKVCKYEALARIKNSNDEIIMPIEFLSLSKRLKLYPQITKLIIEKSFEIFDKRDEELSINLTYGDITNKDMVSFITYKLNQYPNVAKKLTVEILETENVDDYEKLLHFYQNIKLFGSKLAIDDFGSGYSNIMHIFKLKPDYIKIDGSLIQSIDTNAQNKVFVKSVVSFAKSYGIKTVAEFVSNERLAEVVKELEIDISQGYYYAEPKELS
jgi:diguanylate cyclase (GGDEF)-like protein